MAGTRPDKRASNSNSVFFSFFFPCLVTPFFGVIPMFRSSKFEDMLLAQVARWVLCGVFNPWTVAEVVGSIRGGGDGT